MATIAASQSASTSQPSNSTTAAMHSHPFTCVTCAIAFRSSELQRGHMRSDWHRYNLKRRVASLPPLSSEIFADKVLSVQASSSAAAAKASFEKSCAACQKTYYSENAHLNHLGSQKHRLREVAIKNASGKLEDLETGKRSSTPLDGLASLSTASKVEESSNISKLEDSNLDETSKPDSLPCRTREQDSAEARPTQLSRGNTMSEATDHAGETTSRNALLNRCLFCNYQSPSLKLSVMHMTKFHGMFIPEQAYLVNLEGLIGYLQAKVLENHECLLCHKLKTSGSSIQTHMRDKGHCMIAFDTEDEMIEVGQYYDFRSTYSDEESDEERLDHDAHANAKTSSAWSSLPLSDPTDGWETDSSASVDSVDLTALPIDHDHAYQRLDKHRHHTHSDPRPHRALDGFHSHAHSHHAAFHSDHLLHLPSGRTAGHRSLARYYRQNLHSYPTPEERSQRLLLEAARATDEDSDNHAADNSTMTRANGGMGMLGVSEAKKREVKAVEKREQIRAERAQRSNEWSVNKRGNSQKHFRDPLLQ